MTWATPFSGLLDRFGIKHCPFQNGYGIPLYFEFENRGGGRGRDNQATLTSTSNVVGYGRPFWQDFVNNELNFILKNNNNNNSETNVICYDRSFDSKWLIQGKDSKAFLEQLCGITIDDNGKNDAKGLVTVVMDGQILLMGIHPNSC